MKNDMILSLVLFSIIFATLGATFGYFGYHQENTKECFISRKSSLWFSYFCFICLSIRLLIHVPIIVIPWNMKTLRRNEIILELMQKFEIAGLLLFLFLFTMKLVIFREECGILNSVIWNYIVVAYTILTILLVCQITQNLPKEQSIYLEDE